MRFWKMCSSSLAETLKISTNSAGSITSGSEENSWKRPFARDALDPDAWWEHISQSEENADIEDFAARCRRLDFRDQRANIVFGRRLERLRSAGHEEVFIELAKHLLAHRPINHELWLEMGRLHERRSEIDAAWSCYDQVQQLRPHLNERDRFLGRLKGNMDGEEKKPWSGPSIGHRKAFLEACNR